MKVIRTRSEKLLYFMARMIFYGFKSVGLAPISLHTEIPARNSCNTSIRAFMFSKVGLFYNIILLILIPIIAKLGFTNLTSMNVVNPPDFNWILDVILYILRVFTTWFFIFYWVLSQKKAARTMNRLLDARHLLSIPKDQSSNEWMLSFLALHVTFNVFLWITVTVSLQIYLDSLLITITCTMPQLVPYSLFIEYSMVLGLVARELENLNNNLLTLKEFPSYLFHTYSSSSDHLAITILPTGNKLEAIQLLHNIRTTLSEVSQDVADFFSLPILFSISINFLSLVINFHYIILPALNSAFHIPLIAIIANGSFILVSIYPIISLASNVTKTKKKAELTGQLVHKLLATATKREIIAELEQFSLQLIHERLSFTAYGFFELDFTLLQSIVGATATYLVILFQFA